jgi:DHA1 family bicyclomycin/chloramphenicol resistance-like MFS transporter
MPISTKADATDPGALIGPAIGVLILLTLFQMILPLAVDVSLPAMPVLLKSFGTTQAGMQATLAAFLTTFGISQLFWGPVSDGFGRKRPALAGVLLFIVGSGACALADSVQWLLVARIVQAMGACALMVIGSAMVRDLHSGPTEEGRARSLILMLASVGPIFGAIVGGQVVKLAGGHAVFVLQAIIGAVILFWVAMTPETLRVALRSRTSVPALLKNYARVLSNRTYLRYALSGSLMTASMIVYLSASPFVFIGYFKIPTTSYGFYTAVIAVGMALTSMLGRQMVRKLGAPRLLRAGILIGVTAAVAMIIVTSSATVNLAMFFVPLLLSVSTLGLTTPNSVASALAELPNAAGAGAAVFGALAIGIAGVATSILGAVSNGTPSPMAFVMATCCVLALLCNVLLAAPKTELTNR